MAILVEEIKKSISKSVTEITGSLVSRYYYNRAPQNTSYPYVVYYLLIENFNGNDSGTKYSDVRVQFNVFDNNTDYGTRCNSILSQIVDYYDLAKDKLIVSGSYTMINSVRDFILPPKEVESVWQCSVQYTLHVKN